ncbi:hypothetical protein ACHQM5_014085 [Ranunculus cassubicifolius]
MAPGTIASPTLGLLHDNLNSLIATNLLLLKSFNEDLEKLSNLLSSIQTLVAADFEKAFKERLPAEARKELLDRIEDAASDTQNLFDKLEIQASQSLCFEFVFRYKMEKRIKQLIQRFEKIYKV